MKRTSKVLFPFLLAASLLAVGCGDDGGSAGPPDRPRRDAGTDGDVTNDGGGQDGNVDGGDGAVSCDGPNGCFNCEPTTSLELLNRCTSAQCEPYDNRANLPLLREDGTVPPLP